MRELLARAALQEEDVVVVGDAEQLAHERDGLVVHAPRRPCRGGCAP